MGDLIPSLRVAQNSDASAVQSENTNSRILGGNAFFNDLRRFIALPGMLAVASGAASFNDGGQGIFQFFIGSASDDNANILVVNPLLAWPPGYWQRVDIGGNAPPSGVSIQAAQNIFAGAFVTVFNSGGVTQVELADGTNPAKPANGFSPTPILLGNSGLIQFFGVNAVTVATPATAVYLSDTTPGAFQTSPPTTAGHIVQNLGPAIVGVGVVFNPGIAIEL